MASTDAPNPAKPPSTPHDPVTHGKGHHQNEKELETALEDTFPASDPPSQSSPTQAVGWEEPKVDAPKADNQDKAPKGG